MAARFLPERAIARVSPHGHGRIHDTFVVETSRPEVPRLLLQRLNGLVFRDPEAVMHNVARVCAHVQGKLGAGERALQLVPTLEGALSATDDEGAVYRAFAFIERARSLAGASTPSHARQAGRAFGRFQRQLVDLPPPPLSVTIPSFHDTVARLRTLEDMRPTTIDAELAQLRASASVALAFSDAVDGGHVPVRVAHNDAKMDNVLLDEVTDDAVCVVDLDTVMPGAWLDDVGDLARSVMCGPSEERFDMSAMEGRLPLLVALLEGYVGEVAPELREGEWAWLSRAPQRLALELAARFLTDHLQGDVYFKVDRPGQNLQRARVQLAALAVLQRLQPELQRVIDALRSRA
jgi:Ser/Thr protein kinase RdoA (MazF antagonist)